ARAGRAAAAGGAALLRTPRPAGAAAGGGPPAPTPGAAAHAAGEPTSSAAATLADYVAKALDRDLPAEVVARVKLHVLDTFAAIVSGSRLKAGELAARYVDSQGGKPHAMVLRTP